MNVSTIERASFFESGLVRCVVRMLNSSDNIWFVTTPFVFPSKTFSTSFLQTALFSSSALS